MGDHSTAHGCCCSQCPPWWVTMGFVPPLQAPQGAVPTPGQAQPVVQGQAPVSGAGIITGGLVNPTGPVAVGAVPTQDSGGLGSAVGSILGFL